MDGFITVKRQPNIIWIYDRIINDRIDCNYYKVKYIEDDKLIQRGPYRTIGELLRNKKDLTGGATPLGANYLNDGVKFIRTQNVECNWINLDDVVYISDKVHNTLLKRSILEENDVLLTITGANFGKSAPVRKQCLPANISQHSVRIHLKDKIDPYFLSSYLNCSYGQSQIYKHSVGFTRPAIDYIGIKQIKIPTPHPKVQKYIGNKVRQAERLREEAKVLKEEAWKLFLENFQDVVNYEKVKINSKWVSNDYLTENNVIPNFYKQFDLFKIKDKEFVYFEALQQDIKCGIPVKKDMRLGSEYPFYGASGIVDSIGEYNFDGDYLIIAQDGSIGEVNVARGKFWANNHVWVVTIRDGWDLEFLQLYLQFYPFWVSVTTGSVVPKVTSENLKKVLVPKTDYDLQEKIGLCIRKSKNDEEVAANLIQEAKKDVEDLIEGTFDYSKVQATVPESR